jgi:hypothetical protein
MRELRESDTPVEPEGEVAQITDNGSKRPVADILAVREIAAVPVRKDAGETPAPQGATIKVRIGSTLEAPVGEEPAARAMVSSNRAGETPAPQGVKPLRLSLRFPPSPSASVPKSLRVANIMPPGAAGAPTPGREPTIVAKLGTGDGCQGTGPLRPIHLSIKGSVVTVRPDADASPEKTDATPAKPKEAPKTGAAEPSAKEKSARAAARLRQWSLLGNGVKPETAMLSLSR